jgi:hypothetical protein
MKSKHNVDYLVISFHLEIPTIDASIVNISFVLPVINYVNMNSHY